MAESLNFSQRLVRKGALVEETYQVLRHWDLSKTLAANLEAIRRENPVGARNEAWLREISVTLSNRFSNGDEIASLVTLARNSYSLENWRFCFLWHLGSTDGLFLKFASEFLYPKLKGGVIILTTDEVIPFVIEQQKLGLIETELSSYGQLRTARDLLRMAAAFDLVKGQPRRQFTRLPIPEDAILYALYSLMDEVPSVDRAIHSERWRLFLMGPDDVERELFNLHQFHRLRYEVAGTVRELSLPFSGLDEYVQSLIQ